MMHIILLCNIDIQVYLNCDNWQIFIGVLYFYYIITVWPIVDTYPECYKLRAYNFDKNMQYL